MRKLTCHCGEIEAEINLDGDLQKILQCNCSFCKRRNAVMSMVKNEDFKIIKGEEKLKLYQFHSKVAKHYFCTNCGIYTHHNPRANPAMTGFNLGCIDEINTFNLKTFDGYIDVFKGPDWEIINNLTKKKLVDQEFIIGSNNRMAYILSGLNIKNRLSILSSSILPGTVQLTPNGDLIVVMRDGQITGGYPRILQLTEMSQSKLSQCFLGQKIVFKISEPDKLHQKLF